MVKFYSDFNDNHEDLMGTHFGHEGYGVSINTKHLSLKSSASIQDATSSVSGQISYPLSNDVNVALQLSTPHHYLLKLSTDLGDRFKDTALKVNLAKLQADLECDESTFTYPTTFHAHMIFNRMVALHAQVMTEKGNNLEAQIDVLARLTQNVYGGTQIIYDDKARGVIFMKYGLFLKGAKNFNLGLEYNHIGDQCSLDGTVYHQATPLSAVGSTFSIDCATKKISMKHAIHHTLDANTSVKARFDHQGAVDVALSAKISDQLTATFTTGGNMSAFFSGRTNDEAYSGLNFRFVL